MRFHFQPLTSPIRNCRQEIRFSLSDIASLRLVMNDNVWNESTFFDLASWGCLGPDTLKGSVDQRLGFFSIVLAIGALENQL